MLNNNKGMTLVILLVTIIVLLTLAGTVVCLVFGKNGAIAESKLVVQIQERNYAEKVVGVGLKGVRLAEKEKIEGTENTTSEKMDMLLNLLDRTEFYKESDTIIVYNSDKNKYKITVNFDNYTINKIEE